MHETLNFGILGCGLAAEFHAAAIAATPGAVLAGACDVDPAKAAAFAEKHGCRSFCDRKMFFESEEIDAVCICTPSGYHAQDAIEALKARKHVLIEKPVAVDPGDARRIAEVAEKSGRTVGVVAQLRLTEAVQRIKKALDEGRLGRIVSVQLEMLYHRSEEYYKKSTWRGTRAIYDSAETGRRVELGKY